MSYTRKCNDFIVFVNCVSNPELNYEMYYQDIENKIMSDEYKPKTTMESLIKMIVLSFDCDDNYGEYDENTGCGGYGNEFALEECFRYIEEHGGYAEFDYYC
ncbi:MAG: hypothetical protein PUC23_03450 [bacterium]|nr:hypothetical protein [bacterium]